MHTSQSFTRSIVFLAVWSVVLTTSARSDDRTTSTAKEQGLIAVLRSDAAPADKAVACKKLAIDGSSSAVHDLSDLLSDPQLSSWARIALEAIPGKDADEALRDAAESLDGILLVGVINSIGVRQDAEAVDALTTRLQEKNAQVASAAAVALGRIGNSAATQALRQALATAPADVRSAVAEGFVLCAEREHAAGKSEAATEIYDTIRNADVPKQRIIEATRGAILARNQAGVPLLLKTLRSPDKKLFQVALSTLREFPGSEVDLAVATELTNASPQRAALIIQALADRPDTVVLAEVLKAASQGDKQVRISAIDALRRVGDQSCLPVLLKIASADDADLANAAKVTLTGLPGANVDAQIVARLPGAEGKRYALLLRLIGQRRIEAVDALVKALDHTDPAIRSAALFALGETVNLNRLSILISQVESPKHPEDATQAQQALKVASIRMPDREQCTKKLVDAMKRSPSATKSILLEVVGAVGGSNALQTLADAAKSADPEHQDISTRLLGKWNSADAAPVLLDLAKTAPGQKYQIRALRGYLGIARKFPMTDQQRVEMCGKAMDVSSRTAEQQLVLEVLKLHPSRVALNLAIKAQQTPELKNEATAATEFIRQKLDN
ncbi:MAG: HEAT repeat domain-containing protein [Bythopirellula sp.]